MADVSVGILGLNRAGASIGKALKRYNARGSEHNFTTTGYDVSGTTIRIAQKMDAIDKTVNRIQDTVKDKDIIIITMPYNEVEDVYEIIAPNLRTGAVVVDMSPLKQKPIQWAAKHLREGAHLVGATPIGNPAYLWDGIDETERATEDYFDNSSILLMPSVTCIKEAITLVSDFTEILGATPLFFDPAEHDVLTTSTRALPMVLGVAYYSMLSRGSGWDDAQRLTGAMFGMLTHHLFDTHPDDMREIWLDAGSDLARNIDGLISVLTEMRGAIAEGDRDTLEAVLEQASKDYELWINRRFNNKWQFEERLESNSPKIGGMMSSFMGSFIPRRNRDDDDK